MLNSEFSIMIMEFCISVSLNLLKTLPESRIDKRYEEGSPEDLQTLESHFSAAARERAGINAAESISRKKSAELTFTPAESAEEKDPELCSIEANLLTSFVSLYSDGDSKLQEGLRVSGSKPWRWLKIECFLTFFFDRYCGSKRPWSFETKGA